MSPSRFLPRLPRNAKPQLGVSFFSLAELGLGAPQFPLTEPPALDRYGPLNWNNHPLRTPMILSRLIVASACSLGICLAPAAAEAPTPPPKPSSHTTRVIEGWTVRIDDRLLEPANEALGTPILKSLEARLADIRAVVSEPALAKLKEFAIVLDLTHGKLVPMQYHPGADWLKDNGYAEDLVRCVHIPQAAALLEPRQINVQPWCVLHELAHAYHDQVLGFEEPRILAAYEKFKASGHGDQALLITGERVRHYGLTDQKEFFSEMTEAYFGTNDFFPFNRGELMTTEPEIFALMKSIWGPLRSHSERQPTTK